jgi:hypothetical protein
MLRKGNRLVFRKKSCFSFYKLLVILKYSGGICWLAVF